MTENHYLEQAEKDRLELEQHRLNYMAGDTPIEPSFMNCISTQKRVLNYSHR